MGDKKIKEVVLIDNTVDKIYNGHKFTVAYNQIKVIKPKVKTSIVRKPRVSKPPVWFQTWSDMVFAPFVKKTDARFEILENNDKKIFDILERNNIRFKKIEERLERLEKNNIK